MNAGPASALAQRVAAARRALRTVPDEPGEARFRLADTVRHVVGADFACTYHVVGARGNWRVWIPPNSSGMSAAGGAWASRGNARRLELAFDPELPPPSQVGRFTSLVDQKRHLPLYSIFYEPFGFSQQLRSLFYDRGRFIGWFGVLRCRDRAAFGDRERNALNALAPAIQRTLSLVERREREAVESVAPGHVLVSPAGRILGAAEDVRPWLTESRRRALGDYARAADGGDAAPLAIIDRAEVTWTRMVGERTAYLMTLRGAGVVFQSPLASLTPRQREVGECAAAGATVNEIATELGISANTARQHLKVVYRQLGIASRVELARVLSSWPSPRAE